MQRRLNRSLKTVDEHKRFLIEMANADVPRVRQLIQTSLKHGRSVTFMIEQLRRAVEGIYTVKGFNVGVLSKSRANVADNSFPTLQEKEIDFARLALHLGGSKLVYAQ
jgi:hypothetical protein